MAHRSHPFGAAVLAAIAITGCTCWNDEGCLDGARIRYRTEAPGPYDVMFCIDGTCSSTATIEVSEDGGATNLLELPTGVYMAWISARARDQSSFEVEIVTAMEPLPGGPPADYRVVIEASDGTSIDETVTLEYDGYHPGGELCGGSRCLRAEVEREL